MAGEFEEAVNDLGKFDLPYGREVRMEEVVYEGGMKLLRLRLRKVTVTQSLNLILQVQRSGLAFSVPGPKTTQLI